MSSSNSRFSRRQVLKSLAAIGCGSAIHGLASDKTGILAYAMPIYGRALGPSSTFILVNLGGGCSYNIAPIYHGAYRDENPTISYSPELSLPLTSEQGVHPSMTLFRDLYNENSLALLNKVGYPDPNRSHEESTTIWHTALRTRNGILGGWGARLTSQVSSFFAGVSLGGVNDLIRGGSNPPRAFGNLQTFGENQFEYNQEKTDWLKITRETLLSLESTPANDNLRVVSDAMTDIQRSVEIVRQETSAALPTITNPFPNTGFGRACRDAAKLLAAPSLGTRFIYLQMGGFDTHSEERTRQVQLLNDLNAGLTSLVQTAKALGRWNNTVIATMSEFCRTWENASQGTDHGHAAPLFVAGGSVNGRIVNAPPTPAEVTAGQGFLPNYEIDFRQVYYEIVSSMGLNADTIFPQRTRPTPLGIIRP